MSNPRWENGKIVVDAADPQRTETILVLSRTVEALSRAIGNPTAVTVSGVTVMGVEHGPAISVEGESGRESTTSPLWVPDTSPPTRPLSPHAEARRFRAQGLTFREIGAQLGVSPSTARRWCK